jgi:hypothetical protein
LALLRRYSHIFAFAFIIQLIKMKSGMDSLKLSDIIVVFAMTGIWPQTRRLVVAAQQD